MEKIEAQGIELGWPDAEVAAEKQEVAIKNFRGIDKESFLSKTTKAYMALLGDGRGGIYCENSLENPNSWSTEARNAVRDSGFKVILTNPPYGSKLKIDDTAILTRFALGHKWKLDKTSKELEKQTAYLMRRRHKCFLLRNAYLCLSQMVGLVLLLQRVCFAIQVTNT